MHSIGFIIFLVFGRIPRVVNLFLLIFSNYFELAMGMEADFVAYKVFLLILGVLSMIMPFTSIWLVFSLYNQPELVFHQIILLPFIMIFDYWFTSLWINEFK